MGETKKLTIPDGYEFDRVENGEVILKKKEVVLPKTVRECYGIMDDGIHYCPEPLFFTINRLRDLIVCRYAWWKRLEWEPNWKSQDLKYVIGTSENVIEFRDTHFTNNILAFPTEEVRNKFYEAFRDLIEEAKELL